MMKMIIRWFRVAPSWPQNFTDHGDDDYVDDDDDDDDDYYVDDDEEGD